jgi:hypothetical protein
MTMLRILTVLRSTHEQAFEDLPLEPICFTKQLSRRCVPAVWIEPVASGSGIPKSSAFSTESIFTRRSHEDTLSQKGDWCDVFHRCRLAVGKKVPWSIQRFIWRLVFLKERLNWRRHLSFQVFDFRNDREKRDFVACVAAAVSVQPLVRHWWSIVQSRKKTSLERKLT